MMAFYGQIAAGFCLVSAIAPTTSASSQASCDSTLSFLYCIELPSAWPEGETLAGRPHPLTGMPGAGVPSTCVCPLFSIRSRAQGNPLLVGSTESLRYLPTDAFGSTAGDAEAAPLSQRHFNGGTHDILRVPDYGGDDRLGQEALPQQVQSLPRRPSSAECRFTEKRYPFVRFEGSACSEKSGSTRAQEPAGGFEGCWMFLLHRWDGNASAPAGQFGEREMLWL